MKPANTVILIVVLSVGGSFFFSLILSLFSKQGGEEIASLRLQVADLSREVGALSAANRDLADSVAALRAGAAGAPLEGAREPVESIAVEVDRWIRENRPDLLAAGGPASSAGGGGQPAEGTNLERAAQMLALLNDPEMSEADWGAVWNKINEAGLMDEAIALLEKEAADDPNNPEAHMALAGGYLARTVHTANDLEKGTFAIAADKSLDRVLELNPGHWDARFTKASSLTFYPPIMGKQGEALKHFEILLEQQESLPPDPKYSQTYLFLGNLHQQMGNHQEANRVWKEGLAQFPGSADLAKQIENAMKN